MATTAVRQKTILGHPAGLFVLFFTEMWERFSYYGMRALLTLYMIQYLFVKADQGAPVMGYETIKGFVGRWVSSSGITDTMTTQIFASQMYGFYTGLVFFTPFFGGILADRWLGQRRSVYLGGFLFVLGHFMMAFESLFFVALFVLIIANGCFKPNISTQVGLLYPQGDPRRDSAFSIFYMGINIGGFLSPIVCGALGQIYGWHYGFAAAGVGMCLGVLTYHFGRHLLPVDQLGQLKQQSKTKEPLTRKEWQAVLALAGLFIVTIIFWALFEQQGNTLQLWAEENTDWMFFGKQIPSSIFQSFNPFFIVAFVPLLNIVWAKQAAKGEYMSSVTKMGIACFMIGAAFLIMIGAASLVGPGEKGSVMWLVANMAIATLAEIYLSPIGLSLVTKVSPPKIVSMMMGLWFMASALGNYLSGYLGSFYNLMSKDAFFGMLTLLGVGAGVVFVLFNKPLKARIGANV